MGLVKLKLGRENHVELMKDLRNLSIDATLKTPQVDFNPINGNLILHGKSIMENASKFYEPLFNWINDYCKNPRQTTNLRLNLAYFNTASSIWISKIVKSLSRIDRSDYLLYIHLYFDIEDYDDMETDDIKDALSSIVDIVSVSTISIGVKIYGVDEKGKILKESIVLV